MDYTTVKVPMPLAKRIETVSEANGYRSVSEFVIESIRYRLDSLNASSVRAQ
jgi:Arc/MetJ-type ribon-helix-helix transcriptional regulator